MTYYKCTRCDVYSEVAVPDAACWLCGEPMDYGAPNWSTPMHSEVAQ